jgi:DNA-binding transcriptional LysR family regulator
MNEPWQLPPMNSGIGSIIIAAFRASGLHYPHTTVITEDAQMRMSLVASGRFLSILPNSLLRFPIKRAGIKVLPVELQNTGVPVSIVSLKNRTLSPIAKLFIEHAREVAKFLAKKKW